MEDNTAAPPDPRHAAEKKFYPTAVKYLKNPKSWKKIIYYYKNKRVTIDTKDKGKMEREGKKREKMG